MAMIRSHRDRIFGTLREDYDGGFDQVTGADRTDKGLVQG